MALVASTLGNELANLEPTIVEVEAIAEFVAAWDEYFKGSAVNGIPAIQAVYAPGLAAMQVAMTGMSVPGAGALSMQLGITAFWLAIAALGNGIWPQPPLIHVPPIVAPVGIAGIAVALTGLWVANVLANVDLDTASQSTAAILHALGGIGGITILQPVGPVPPIPTPIL